MELKPFTGTLDLPAGLTPYNGPLDGEEPKATAGGLIRSLAASALDAGVGYPLQAGGELLAAGLNRVTGKENFRAANPVGPISNLIREGMSGGDQLAAQDGFKGDVLAPATWETPKTVSGLAHQFAQGAGSLASMAVPGAAAVRSGRLAAGATTIAEKAAAEAAMRRAAGIGAVAGGATTAGAAADEVRANLPRLSDEALYQQSPRFKALVDGGVDAGTARQTVENLAAQAAGTISGVAGAASGAVNARLLEDVIAKRGIPALIGGLSERGVVRAGVGAGLGALGEGAQETAEKVGQNVGESVGLGTPAARDLTRDTLGDFAGGFMIGGPIGALGGHASRASTNGPDLSNGQKAGPGPVDFVHKPETLDANVLAAAVAPEAGPLTRAAGVGVISGAVRAEWARQKGEREAERVAMIDRLTELDTLAAGTPEKKDANGKVTPAEPGILTLAEKNEREQLRADLAYTGQLPPDVAFSPVDLAPKADAVRRLDDEQAVARVEARFEAERAFAEREAKREAARQRELAQVAAAGKETLADEQLAVANAAGSGLQDNAPPNAMQLAFQRAQERKARKAAVAPPTPGLAPVATAVLPTPAAVPVTPAAVAPAETEKTDRTDSAPPVPGWTPPTAGRSQAVVLQNRNRSDAAYVQQVAQIAGNPDPQRLSFSRDFASGAPVVFVEPGTSLAPERLGREETVTAATGRKIPVRYAAVEADELLPSNQVDGTANPEYAGGAPGRIRVVAGNGRAAGIQGAYAKGTAEGYRNGIGADSSLHGVSPEVWAAMRAPVLVRVMPEGEVTPNIGDESNQTGVAEKSALEKAKDDDRRLDLTALAFNEEGDVAPETFRQFVDSMPVAEQTGLRNPDGTPTRQASDRLMAAIFWKAYASDELVRLYAQASDPESRNVMSGLAAAAPQMMRLDGAGDLDIRPLVAEAAGAVISAKRRGISLMEFVKHKDFGIGPETAAVLDMLARNVRSAKKIGEALRAVATLAYDEANKPEDGFFGPEPRLTRPQVLEKLNDTAGSENLGQPPRAEPPEGDAGRRATQAGTRGNGRAAQEERTAYPGADRHGARHATGRQAGDVAGEPDAPYTKDLFGEPFELAKVPGAPRSGGNRPRQQVAAPGHVQPGPAVSDTTPPPGEYHANTTVVSTVNRQLGATRIRSAADLAAATRYLYKSAVERFDGIVTDSRGKPLAVVGSFKGALTQTSVYPATVVAEAIRVPGAAQIWFSHNHPSGTAELSMADRMLHGAMIDAFRGSGIEPMDLIAVAGSRFAGQDGGRNYVGPADIPASIGNVTVPVIEREVDASFDPGLAMSLSSPALAKAMAANVYARNQGPGLMLTDARNRFLAWVPLDAARAGKLRGSGGLGVVYRAISQSNAAGAIIVHGGEYAARTHGVAVFANIGAALKQVDVSPLDAINLKGASGVESAAERGLSLAEGPVYSRAVEDDAFGVREFGFDSLDDVSPAYRTPERWRTVPRAMRERHAARALRAEVARLEEGLNRNAGWMQGSEPVVLSPDDNGNINVARLNLRGEGLVTALRDVAAAADRLELGVVLRASAYGDGVSDQLPRQFDFDRFGASVRAAASDTYTRSSPRGFHKGLGPRNRVTWVRRVRGAPLFSRGPSAAFVETAHAGKPEFRNDFVHLADPDEIKPGRFMWRLLSQELTDEAGDPLYIGFLIADVKDGAFTALRNIEINPALRGRGLGETVVGSMVRHNGGAPLKILDIQHARYLGTVQDPLPFWKKLGTILTNYSSDPRVEMDGILTFKAYHDARANRGPQADRGSLGPDAQPVTGRSGAAQEGRAAQPAGTGLPQEEVARIAGAVAFGKRIHVAATAADLPAAAGRLRSDSKTRIRGVYIPSTDDIWLVAAHLRTPEEVAFVTLHEGAHRGLRKFFGPEIQPVLHRLWLGNANVRQQTAEYQAKYKIGRVEAIEEVLADMAQRGVARDLTGWEKLVAFIKEWVARLADKAGIRLRFTDDMVQTLVGAAARRGLEADGSLFDEAVARQYSRDAPVWYSELQAKVAAHGPGSAQPGQWRAFIKGLTTRGVKADEIAWSGVDEWLAAQAGRVTQPQVLDFLRSASVDLVETHLAEPKWEDAQEKGQAQKAMLAAKDAYDWARLAMREAMEAGTSGEVDGTLWANTALWTASVAKGRIDGTADMMFERDSLAKLMAAMPTPEARDAAERTIEKEMDWLRKAAAYNAVSDRIRRDNTRFGTWQLAGGRDYRELAINLTETPDARRMRAELLARNVARRPGRKAVFDRYQPAIDAMRVSVDRASAAGDSESVDAHMARLHKLEDQRDREAAEVAGEIEDWRDLKVPQYEVPQPHRMGGTADVNRVLHVRFNERRDPQGRRVLFVEEIQSDWAQEGRDRGFLATQAERREAEALLKKADAAGGMRNLSEAEQARGRELGGKIASAGVAPAPLVGKTEAWVGLGLKRLIRWAVEEGFDRIAWTTGAQQAARYDLSQQVDRLDYSMNDEGEYSFSAIKDSKEVIHKVGLSREDLEGMVGKEITEKIIMGEGKVALTDDGETYRSLSGLDLTVGGDGMKTFYDRIVPNVAAAVLKRLGGGRVTMAPVSMRDDEGWGDLATGEADYAEQAGFDLRPALRDRALAGLPLFSRPQDPAQGDLLSSYDEKDLKAKTEREAAAAEAEARAKADALKPPPGKKVTAEQTDMFNGQDSLFSRADGGKLMLSHAAAAKAFRAIREGIGRDDLAGILMNWNDSELSADGDRIIAYVSRDRHFSRGREGGSQAIPKREFLAWLMSDAPFDPAVYGPTIGQDEEWVMQIEAARAASGLPRGDDAPRASRGDSLPGDAQTDASVAGASTPADARTRVDALKDSVRAVALGGFTRHQLADMYGGTMPEVAEYDRMAGDMDSLRANLAQEADHLLTAWRRLGRDTGDRLADIMHEATLGQFDPDTGKKGEDFAIRAGPMKTLVDRYAALPETAKAVYRRSRDLYSKRLRQLFDALAARIQRSGADPEATRRTVDQLRMQYDRHLARGPYFPLARFGDYLLIADRLTPMGTDDDHMVMAFESARERDQEAARMKARGYRVKSTVAKEYSRAKDGAAGPLAAAMSEAIAELDMDTPDVHSLEGKNLGDIKTQLLDELNQALIRGLPELSYRKHFIHRKGTPGFSSDAMRAFADSHLHAANHIARLEYGDQLVRTLERLQGRITDTLEGDVTALQQVSNELVKRHEVSLNHVTHPVAAMLGQVGFVMSLGASVASGVVNLMQTPLVAYPWLASKYGWGKASTALLQAARDYTRSPWAWESGPNAARNSQLSGDQLAMLRELENRGKINTTLAHDLASASSTDNLNQFSKYGSAWQRTLRMVGWTFHVPEVANRQITALATYGLARQTGQTHEAAIEATAEAIDKTHFDYTSGNRARYFEGNFRRVLLMFKQYGQNIAYLYGRAGYQAFRGTSPEEKAEARRLLAGMLTVQFAAAGALGLPFVGAVASILGAMMNGFGDDDEKRDWEVEFRNWLAGTVGKDAGEALSHGLPRLVLGWDLASRIGQNDLFIRAPNREQEGRDAYFAWMQALAGPVAGYALNGYLGLSDIARGVGSLNRGLMMRGTEELMPAAIRNPLRALRYQVEEGVRTRGGEKQIEVTPFEKLGQVMGFTPRRVAEMYEGVSAVKNRQHGIELRRGELLDQFAAAVRERDLRGIGEAMRGIQGFNTRNPQAAISQETIQRSMMNRRTREAGMREGIALPRKHDRLRAESAFANL